MKPLAFGGNPDTVTLKVGYGYGYVETARQHYPTTLGMFMWYCERAMVTAR